MKDVSSRFVAGPYRSGQHIKLNANTGENSARPGPGGVAYIRTAGAAQIHAVDAAGNVSDRITKRK